MASRSYSSSSSRSGDPYTQSNLGRGESSSDQDRPLEDMRKNVNNVLHILFVHRWAFFVPCCTAATIVFGLSLSYPRTYQATTTFERGEDMLMLNLPMGLGTGSFRPYRTTMREDVLSDDVLAEAVENLGWVDADAPGMSDAEGEWTPAGIRAKMAVVSAFRAHVKVSTSSPSEHLDHVTLTYTGPDVEAGKKLIDAAKEAYIGQTMVKIHESLTTRYAYFGQLVAGLANDLNEAKKRRNELLFTHPRLDPMNPSWINQQIMNADAELKQLETKKAEYEEDLGIERQFLHTKLAQLVVAPAGLAIGASGKALTPSAVEANRIRGQLLEIAGKINGLKTSRGMTDAHPEIVELAAQRDWLAERLRVVLDQPQELVASAEQAIETVPHAPVVPFDDSALTAALGPAASVRLTSLNRRIRDTELAIGDTSTEKIELLDAQRTLTPFQESYGKIETEIAGIGSRLREDQDKMRAFEPALAAIRDGKHIYFKKGKPASGANTPVSPKAQATFVLALLAGLGAGAVFVVLAEVFDHIYRNASQISRSLGLPVLETIDEIVTSNDRRRLLLKRLVLTPMAVALALGATGTSASLAYLSIERPWTFERIMQVPAQAADWFADASDEETPTREIVQLDSVAAPSAVAFNNPPRPSASSPDDA